MPQQTLSTQLQLDALLTSGFKDAFASAGNLLSELRKETSDLKKTLGTLGKEADSLDKIGKSSKDVRDDMMLLERQIKETERATEKFGDSKRHFRSASIGARALKNDLGGIVNFGLKAAAAIAGIGTAAAVALSPSEELLSFDQTLAGIAAISPEVDASGIADAKTQIRSLSNAYGTSTAEIATAHEQLTRAMGFEAAGETIAAAVEFQTTTGLSIADLEEELATARISLSVDTPNETREFLQLLSQAHQQGIKIDNIDLGDMETLLKRTGSEGVFGQEFQREFLTTIAFRQLDSFQFADYSTQFQEEFNRSIVITPEMEVGDITKAQDNLLTLQRYGIRAEDGILGAMRAFQQLNVEQQAAFREQLSPILGEQVVEVVARGSEALPQVTQQVDAILNSQVSMEDAAANVANTWSGAWARIGTVGGNTLGILQERFAAAFGPPIIATAERLFDFISSHQAEIQNFFTGVRDGVTPVVSRIWQTIRNAYPTVRDFAIGVWQELRQQWSTLYGAAKPVLDVIWGFTKAVGGFLAEHPKLIATLVTGAVLWKSYQIAASGFKVVGDVVSGAASLAGGHIHRLNAMILQNARVSGTLQTASSGIRSVFGGIGRAALGAIPGIGAMGGSMMAALAPIVPIALPIIGVVAGIGAAAFIVYKNWAPISGFFAEHFEKIRNVLMFVFPPLGLLVGFAGVIRDNWAGISEFFSTIWETVKLSFQVAFEFIKFVALSGLLGIKKAWASVTGFFSNLWDGIRAVFLGLPLFPIFADMVRGVSAVFSPLFGFFSDFWGSISRKAGEVLGWITDKFKFINNLLRKAFGWLRKKNDEIKEELNMKAEVSVEKPEVVTADMVAPKLETPVMEAQAALEQQSVELEQFTTVVQEQSAIGNQTPAVDYQQPVPAMEMPVIEAPVVNVATPETVQPEIAQSPIVETPVVNVAQHTEMPAFSTVEIPETETLSLEMPVVNVAQPVLDMQTPVVNVARSPEMAFTSPTEFIQENVGGQESASSYPMPIVDMAQPTIETPAVEIPDQTPVQFESTPIHQMTAPAASTLGTRQLEDIGLGLLIENRKQTMLLEHLAPDMELPDTQHFVDITQPSVEVPAVETPAVEISTIETASIDTPQVAIETPEIEQVSPIVEVATPSVEIPGVMMPTIETPSIDTPQVAIETPEIETPGVMMPTIETASIDTPQVAIETPTVETPAVMMPTIETPSIETPSIETPQVAIETPEIEQVSPMVDVATPEIEQVSPMVDIVSPELETPMAVVETPEVELQDYTVPSVPSVEQTDIFNEGATSTETATTTNAPTINLTLNVNQQPGQDTQALVDEIMRQINESTGTFYQQ